MAITKIRSSRKHLKDALDYTKNEQKTLEEAIAYVENPEKVSDVRYVTGINCISEVSADDMLETKKRWGKTEGIQYFHAIQSFAPGEISPDKAHEIGKDLASLLWGDRFEVVVSTHLDKEHIHNHFIINSVSFLDGGKYHLSQGEKLHFKNLSDQLCFEHELSVITEPSRDRKKEINRARNRTHRAKIREDINRLIPRAENLSDMLRLLAQEGYLIKSNVKHIAIRRPGMERFIRLRSLGDSFIPEAIETRIQKYRSGTHLLTRKAGRSHQAFQVKHPKKNVASWIDLLLGRRPYFVRCFRFYYRKFQKLLSTTPNPKTRNHVDHGAVFEVENFGKKILILHRYQIKTFMAAVQFLKEDKGTKEERELLKEIIKDTRQSKTDHLKEIIGGEREKQRTFRSGTRTGSESSVTFAESNGNHQRTEFLGHDAER